jgi:hypothetical protein
VESLIAFGHDKDGFADDCWDVNDSELMALVIDHPYIGYECMECTYDLDEEHISEVKEYLNNLGFVEGIPGWKD